MKNEVEQIALQNDMSIEFVTWFFNEKKAGCGNVWFMMMAAMWEGWKGRSIEMDKLAAENVALKSKGKELLGEACAVYSRLNKLIDPSIVDFVDGQTLHEFQFVLNSETPATDRIVAGIKADGVEEFAAKLRIPGDDQFFDALAKGVALAADDFAKQLREGADK
ncbi:TPA: hypothetical protein MBH96_002743 [Klebsiella pneumoniae]|nr:hypothetical protein [Klebsiella pneumoniae]